MLADVIQKSRETQCTSSFPVCSYNEWDLLEEVIVGVVDGARFPPWHVALKPVLPIDQHTVFRDKAGSPFPSRIVEAANCELEEFVHILLQEGVKVRRPQSLDTSQSFGAPGWNSTGLYHAMPRDLLLIIGHEIIECPLAWRSRYCEIFGYRSLIKEYFNAGAKWTSAPKPELPDIFYNKCDNESDYLAINEFEPTFDAADFIRCGKDIFAQKSNVTNDFGIEWLRQHLGSEYKIHVLKFNDPHPMHIDATLMPVAPGKLLINPERVLEIPKIFKNWDVKVAPKPIIPDNHTLYMTSKWINMNILMLDEKRVVVEKQDEPMITLFRKWGFTTILCNFRNFNSFGGSFHCATLDVRRKGQLQSYF